jgi:cellulose synthase (UDP-forming)
MTNNKTITKSIHPPLATLLLLGIVLLTAGITFLWATEIGVVGDIFTYLNLLQEQPPMWVEAPMVMTRFLLLPSITIFILVFVITKVSPKPSSWSQFLVVAILLILAIRYVQWRSLSTLNLSDPLNGVFSISLFILEMFVLFSSSLQLFLTLKVKDRQRETDALSRSIVEKTFSPTVDIFIPTYDEPDFILRRTIIGCQAIDYDSKTVYILDDTKRPQIANLAHELGCEYLTRPNNDHAKAGNLNHALPQTKGELIAVFDADFIPTRNFFQRTLGFFQNDNLALVQTPQSFYNIDPIARNLGLENVLTPEEEVFYRQLQPIKDGAGSVVCSGTSFVVRRKALESIGGFVTDSLSEDYFTGIRLSSQGYGLVYIDEKLSAGLAAENIAAHATQRLRWARGTLQAFFIKSNPLTIPGLNPLQRLAHLEGLLHWFISLANVFFLLMPLAYAFLQIIPLRATTDEFLFFFLPYYITQITVFSWLNYQSRSAILSGIYGLVLAFPLAATVIQVMLNPFSTGFKVTPKGTKSDRFSFNWKLALPLIILFVFTALSLWKIICICAVAEMHDSLEMTKKMRGLNLGWIWSAYNLISIGVALLILLDVPKADLHEWFNLRRSIKLNLTTATTTQTYWGTTTRISQTGADISLTQKIEVLNPNEIIPANILILEENLALSGLVNGVEINEDNYTVQVQFKDITLEQERQLISMLFCRPGQWKRKNTPGELASLWLLVKVLLRPKILFERNPKITTIKVRQS